MSSRAEDNAKVVRGGDLQSGSLEQLLTYAKDKAPCKWKLLKIKCDLRLRLV